MNKAFTASVLGTCALVSAASAGTVDVTFGNVIPGESVQFSTNAGANWTGTTAGRFNFTANTSTDSRIAAGDAFYAFCIEVLQNISPGQNVSYTSLPGAVGGSIPGNGGLGTPIQAAQELLLQELWGTYRTGLSTATQYAAFQVAIWEIVYDTGLDTNAGDARFQGNGPAISLAQSYLDYIGSNNGPLDTSIFALVSTQSQDMLVPTPAAAAVLGLGALAATRRRRSK